MLTGRLGAPSQKTDPAATQDGDAAARRRIRFKLCRGKRAATSERYFDQGVIGFGSVSPSTSTASTRSS